MGKLKDENFFVVHGWMLNQLKLKGIELMLYSIIWGFTQEVNTFTGSLSYLEEFTGATRPTVIEGLKRLCEKKLLEKCIVNTEKGKVCIYKAVKNLNTPSKETLPTLVKKLNNPSKEILPNNILYNINNNININKSSSTEDVKKEKKIDNNAIELSNLLYQECKKQNDKFKVTDKQLIQWASDIEKLNRIDGYDYSVIKDVLLWCKNDNFWSVNILSGSKFRKQFNRLILGAKQDNKIKENRTYNNTPSQDKDIEEQMNNTIQELYDGQDYV